MLTEQQETFARAIAAGRDTAAAAAVAYPCASRKSQARHSRRLLRMPKLQERIAALSCEPAGTVPPRVPAAARGDMGADLAALEIAELAGVAFDVRQPDIVRLAALRRLDVALARAARDKRCTGDVTVSLSITVSLHVPLGA